MTKDLIDSEVTLAQNIKNPTHRKSILKALRSIGTPQPNTAIFASPNNPPVFVEFNHSYSQYICGKQFELHPLQQKTSQVYVVMISRDKSTIAKVVNSKIHIIYRISNSGVPSKHNQGGQSQARIMRGMEILVDQHVKKAAEKANELIPLDELVIISANLSTNGIINKIRHKNVIIGPTPEYQDVSGIHNLIKSMKDELLDLEYTQELRLIEEFYVLLETDPGRVSYGTHTEKFKDLVEKYVKPKGNYPEAIAFRKIFQNAAILYYSVNR